MGTYQGRAIRSEGGRPRGRGPLRRLRLVALGLAALLVAFALAHVPWGDLRRRHAVLTEVRIEGARYLDPAAVARAAGLEIGSDLLALDFARARQSLLLHPRIAAASLGRRLPRGVTVRITERVPVLLVRHGEPWEMDSSGVLLAPLARGVVADVPMLSGVSFERVPAGAQVRTSAVARGLAWIGALEARELRLVGQVSELDVGDDRSTVLRLMSGTRVRAGAWPPDVRELSALRVVLADLERRGGVAEEIDLRFRNQVIVRPAAPSAVTSPTRSG